LNDFIVYDSQQTPPLNNGTLTLEGIRRCPDYYCHVSEPRSEIGDHTTKLFLSEDDADLAFKKARLSILIRLIINCQKPDLSELCDTYSDTNPMPIEDVDPLAPSIIFIIFELMPQSGRLNLLILLMKHKITSRFLEQLANMESAV
jgi:hypothetical protein